MHIDDLKRVLPRARLRLPHRRAGARTGRTSARLQAQDARAAQDAAVARCKEDALMAKLPASPSTRWSRATARTCNDAPPGGWDAASASPTALVKTHCCFCGQQCGIQLKVRDEPGRRLRALGGVPVQPRHALPQGREALPAERASRPPARRRSCAPRPRLPRRSAGTRRSTSRPRALREIQDAARPGRRRGATAAPRSPPRRRTCWASSRASALRHARTSTTTAGSAWSRPATAYKLAFGVDRAPNPWSDIPQGAGAVRRRRQRRRVRADHHRLHLAVRATTAAS